MGHGTTILKILAAISGESKILAAISGERKILAAIPSERKILAAIPGEKKSWLPFPVKGFLPLLTITYMWQPICQAANQTKRRSIYSKDHIYCIND